MNDDVGKEILEELRKQTRYAIITSLIPIVLLALLVVFYLPFGGKESLRSKLVYGSEASWGNVRYACDCAEYEKALAMTQELVEKAPDYYYGYGYLGLIYQAMGDLTKAEENYAKAYELFPLEENKESLDAVRKRLKSKK